MGKINHEIIAMCIAMLLFISCASPLPKPIPIIEEDINTNQSRLTEKVNSDVLYMRQMTVFNNIPKTFNNARKIISDIYIYLSNNFGAPICLSSPVIIEFVNGSTDHAVMSLGENSQRTVKVDVFNLYKKERHFLAHELFHAFYQDDDMLNGNIYNIEKWATYAQYLYKYRGYSNHDIRKRLSEYANLSNNELAYFEKYNGPLSALNADQQLKAYVTNVLPLFENKHMENYAALRDKLNKQGASICKRGGTNKNQSLVHEVQKRLIKWGFMGGDLTGQLDNRTINAIKHFQRKHGIKESGKLDRSTLKAIGVSRRKD